jgi:hypothetical protein
MHNLGLTIAALWILSVLTACATPSPRDSIAALQTERQRLQLAVAQTQDLLWWRAGLLPELAAQTLPLISEQPQTLQRINAQLQHQLTQLQQQQLALMQRVSLRQQSPSSGPVLHLQLMRGLTQDSPPLSLVADPMMLVLGQAQDWLLSSHSRTLPVSVIWSETGVLYIEGQQVAYLEPSSLPVTVENEITWYATAVQAQGKLRLTLHMQLE